MTIEMSEGFGQQTETKMRRIESRTQAEDGSPEILRLLLEDRFPRIWVAIWENRDLRPLLWHRHPMVQARTRIMNQLQAVANEIRERLWRETGGSTWIRSG
jgi:transposase